MLGTGRKEIRGGEQIGIGIMQVISFIPGLGGLKPIQGKEVAQAMINATFKQVLGIRNYTMGGVFKLAKLQ